MYTDSGDALVELGRAPGTHGEVVLRRRGDGPAAVEELIVNGAFAMDSAETSSERALARLPFDYQDAQVLLGGLGLGYTADALLDADIGRLDVVELEPALVAWTRAGVTPVLARLAADSRVRLVTGDVAAIIRGHRGQGWDAILLDVDNGPDFLIHTENAGLYAEPGIAAAVGCLAPGGLLAVWCQGPVDSLPATMAAYGAVATHTYPVQRGRRSWSYVIYTLHPHHVGMERDEPCA